MKNSGRFWGRWQLRIPSAFVANSEASWRKAGALGLAPEALGVLPNAIDLADFDARAALALPRSFKGPVAVVVGSLYAVKRYDRFLEALALARRSVPELKGLIAGDGPEKPGLEREARKLGLGPPNLIFLGHWDNVPALLRRADMLVVSSDHEGFPNVILEGMAARLPVVTTPAGDAGVVVEHGTTGYVAPFEDVQSMAAGMVRLARSPELRRQFGEEARRRVEQYYGFEGLADRLLALYRKFAQLCGRHDVLRLLRT
jgi:glycosyltransferase involved in cell wall biosynthesis